MAKPPVSSLIRLNKLIAQSGACSRREADRLLANGWVQVDGFTPQQVTKPGFKVPPDTAFSFLPQAQQQLDTSVSLILHKPLGIVSSQPEGPHQTPAIQLLTADNRWGKQQRHPNHVANPHRLSKLAVAGRLDAQSSGLLLFTQSGKLAQQIIGPDSTIEKEYLVRVQDVSTPASPMLLTQQESTMDRIHRLMEGVHSYGDFLQATDIFIQNDDQLNFTLRGGKYHHIRRMCEQVGWQVHSLKRVRIGSIRLQKLPLGKWRYLDPSEGAP